MAQAQDEGLMGSVTLTPEEKSQGLPEPASAPVPCVSVCVCKSRYMCVRVNVCMCWHV